MALFFFDTDDGRMSVRDSTGLELEDREAARREAIAALTLIAKDVLPNDDPHAISVTVRDDQRQAIFHASLTLVAEWLV